MREAHMTRMPLVPMLVLAAAATEEVPTIFEAVLGESGRSTPEVSTEELRRVLADNSALELARGSARAA